MDVQIAPPSPAALAVPALRGLAAMLGFAALVGLGARVQVPLVPVPLTLQVPAVLLAGAVLGARAGAGSMTLYLAGGALGLPLFAAAPGPAALLGPTAGYLLGFVPGAAAAGALARRGRAPFWRIALGMAAGLLAILACGTAFLAVHLGGDLRGALAMGVAPFLAGDLVKVLGAASAARLWGRLRRIPAAPA